MPHFVHVFEADMNLTFMTESFYGCDHTAKIRRSDEKFSYFRFIKLLHMKHLFYTAAALVLLLSACKETIHGDGPLVKQTRTPGEFAKLELDIPAHITYIVADSVSMTIASEQNIIDNIITEVDGRTLEIKSDKDLEPSRPIEIIMTIRTLEGITLNGSGKIRGINTLSGKEIRLNINGSGDIAGRFDFRMIRTEINGSGDAQLQGKCEEQRIDINGSGNYCAEGRQSDVCMVEISGSGDADVNVMTKLSADVVGSGNVRYAGEPSISTNVTGSGEVKKSKVKAANGE